MTNRVYDGPLPDPALLTPKARVIRTPVAKFSGGDIGCGTELIGPPVKLTVIKGTDYNPACETEGNVVFYKGNKMLENGLTAKQELFARCVASGNTLADSYRRAYNVKSAKDSSIHGAATGLMQTPRIRNRVHVLSEEVSKMERYTSERIRLHVIDRLMVESGNEDSKAAERLRALELLGKIYDVSLFKERPTETKPVTLTVEHITNEIEDKLRKVMSSKD